MASQGPAGTSSIEPSDQGAAGKFVAELLTERGIRFNGDQRLDARQRPDGAGHLADARGDFEDAALEKGGELAREGAAVVGGQPEGVELEIGSRAAGGIHREKKLYLMMHRKALTASRQPIFLPSA